MTLAMAVAQSGHSHAAPPGGAAAFVAMAVLLAGAGIGLTYVADAPTFRGDSHRLAAAASAAAAVIHSSAIVHHLEESLLHGLFFIAAASCQLMIAHSLYTTPTMRMLRLAAASSAWLVLLWLVSRSAGVAFISGRESIGFADLASTMLALVVLARCVSSLQPRRPVPLPLSRRLGAR